MEIYDGSSMPVYMSVDGKLKFFEDVTLVLKLPERMVRLGFPKSLKIEERIGNSWDGASIPKQFWWLIGYPLDVEFRWPSFWHDRLCESACTYRERFVADSVFLHLLLQSKVTKVKCLLMWLACRIYAIFIWKPQDKVRRI